VNVSEIVREDWMWEIWKEEGVWVMEVGKLEEKKGAVAMNGRGERVYSAVMGNL
jgi:hypothetical protein